MKKRLTIIGALVSAGMLFLACSSPIVPTISILLLAVPTAVFAWLIYRI